MKKLLFALICLIMMACSEGPHRITYKVYWPDAPKTYVKVIDDAPYLGSDRGTNFLKVGSITGPDVIVTSAPIEIIKVEKLEK